jgi:hypothetical protein
MRPHTVIVAPVVPSSSSDDPVSTHASQLFSSAVASFTGFRDEDLESAGPARAYARAVDPTCNADQYRASPLLSLSSFKQIKFVPGPLHGLLIRLDDRLSGKDVTLIAEFIDANELGLALEQIADVLSEDEQPLTPQERAAMLALVDRMQMDDQVPRTPPQGQAVLLQAGRVGVSSGCQVGVVHELDRHDHPVTVQERPPIHVQRIETMVASANGVEQGQTDLAVRDFGSVKQSLQGSVADLLDVVDDTHCQEPEPGPRGRRFIPRTARSRSHPS